MFEWLDNVAGPGYTAAVLWTFAALVLLVIVLVIVKLVRSLTFGTFVAGGRNRKTRLAVMDATAIDSQRRLVLVRRDDIEHLLLIGGPTDVVVETDIRMTAPRRPALTGTEAVQQAPQAPRPQQAPQQPVPRPAAPATARPQQQQPAPAPIQPRPAPPKMPLASAPLIANSPDPKTYVAPSYSAPARPAPAPVASPSPRDLIDDTLMKELEVSLDDKPQAKPAKAVDPSLDDEMAKLLGELTSHKR
ncbi:flagellar biosynthesis protein FliO [Aminobacter aminovorans]|uniref:Flagellar biosynthesis protein, FliO n=1 Tax=Aminobacter aminovorans TaxID=83263 RepID=A0A380WP61_AMIAI|nr:flagellar biosynthetic protein FliO [Aminobacter aminovorans]TCS26224.1 flagellar biosynthesis protein FliO [Aminobacter aminovorans]SUU90112.1 Flagellar biosynthesis protein, FliO [Aminobacter aminovorans]